MSVRVTIAMPVYRSDPALFRRALDSLLAQSFADFEILISDNGSGPAYEGLYAEAAASDPRVRLLRRPRNQGAGHNYASTVAEARGDLLLWAADDDWRDPHCLAELVALIDRHPNSVLASSAMLRVDERDRPLGPVPFDPRISDSRLLTRIDGLANGVFYMDVYGLFRRRFLAESYVVREIFTADRWAADNLLVLEAILRGPIPRASPMLFRYRLRSEVPSLAEVLLTSEIAPDDPLHQAERNRERLMLDLVWRSPHPSYLRLRAWARLFWLLRHSPFTDERKAVARTRFTRAMERGDYFRAGRAAAAYLYHSPGALLRPSAWRTLWGGR